ncbi:hypothetical protein KY289_030029 [Solanum tuberosum]|nr:hypothetical protein KY289_030029 [Solanum tuberosum]
MEEIKHASREDPERCPLLFEAGWPFACVFFEIGIPTKFPSQSGNKLVRPIKEEGQLAMLQLLQRELLPVGSDVNLWRHPLLVSLLSLPLQQDMTPRGKEKEGLMEGGGREKAFSGYTLNFPCYPINRSVNISTTLNRLYPIPMGYFTETMVGVYKLL